MGLAPDAKAMLLGLVRRGPRRVLWTHPQYGFGNILYLLMHAHRGRSGGEHVSVLRTAALEPWLPDLGDPVAGLVVRREQVRLTDRRDVRPYFDHGRDWDLAQLDAFTDVLLRSPLTRPQGGTMVSPDDVVVVVRRGDYWSVPRFRARYAFDVTTYLNEALAAQQRVGGFIPRVHVISDGLDWCRAHLQWLSNGREAVTFAETHQTARDHFATMVGARRLILTNTTFGYWGGYTSARAHGDTHRLVVAPRFHARGLPGGDDAAQLDPRWTVVDSIPGGWVEPPEDEWNSSDGDITRADSPG